MIRVLCVCQSLPSELTESKWSIAQHLHFHSHSTCEHWPSWRSVNWLFVPLCPSRWCYLVRWFIWQCQPESWQPFKWIPDPVTLLPLAAFIPRGCLLSGNWAPEAERGARGRKSFTSNGLSVSWSKQCSRCPNHNGVICNLQPSHSGQKTLWSHWHLHQ